MLADVRRGIWIPPDRTRTAPTSTRPGEDGITFHRFASDRLAARKGEVAPRTYEFDAWALQQHLLPYFASWPLATIDIQAVDDYRRHKVQQAELRRAAIERGEPLKDEAGRTLRPLAPQTINRTLDVLQAILARVCCTGRPAQLASLGAFAHEYSMVMATMNSPASQVEWKQRKDILESLTTLVEGLEGFRALECEGVDLQPVFTVVQAAIDRCGPSGQPRAPTPPAFRIRHRGAHDACRIGGIGDRRQQRA